MNARQQQAALPQAKTTQEAASLLDQTIEATDMERLLSGKRIAYVPQGETAPIELNVQMVKQFLVKPTKTGGMPTDADVLKFVMLCKARELNPWVGDAFLVGYDGKDGPEYSLITSVHALHKRADRCDGYQGFSAGVVVKIGDAVQEIPGTCYPDGAALLGGWARVIRSDRIEPFYASVRLQSFDKGRSLWNSDKAGMIRKCALAMALREAFPNQTSGLYTTDELPAMVASAADKAKPEPEPKTAKPLSQAAQEASADLDRMLNATKPEAPGDDIAADAEKHLAGQTLPPTLRADAPGGPVDAHAGWLKQLAACKTVEAVDQLVADALNGPDGVDIRREGEDKKAAMTFLERERTSSRNR